MRAITIRMEDKMYDEIVTRAIDDGLSLNKEIVKLLKESISREKSLLSYIRDVDTILSDLAQNISTISKRQVKHFLVTKQHFVNEGYLSNADIRADKSLKDVLSTSEKFND